MLPDGAHDREQDWTVFYLNQLPALTVNDALLSPALNDTHDARAARFPHPDTAGDGEHHGDDDVADDDEEDEDENEEEDEAQERDEEQSDVLYVISLMRTKKSATVRRGALVKAMAVATRDPFIQIYKVPSPSPCPSCISLSGLDSVLQTAGPPSRARGLLQRPFAGNHRQSLRRSQRHLDRRPADALEGRATRPARLGPPRSVPRQVRKPSSCCCCRRRRQQQPYRWCSSLAFG